MIGIIIILLKKRRFFMCERRIKRPDTMKMMEKLIFLFFVYYVPQKVTGIEPNFITPLENITVASGRNAQFTCHVSHLGGHKLAWLRSDSKAILAIHNHMVTNNPRMSVGHNDDGHNSWTLEIRNVQRKDSGNYMCQINTEPMTSQMGHLNVVEAPDILYSETSNDTIVNEGSDLRLRCKAKGYPEPSMTWRREDRRPITIRRSNGGHAKVKIIKGPYLQLKRLSRADTGAFLCIAANGIPSPVSKRIMVTVQFPPIIRVQAQLVATSLGSTVTLSCEVEASPKTVNYWEKTLVRPNNEVRIRSINPSHRFRISEEALSSYSEAFSLTINHVRSQDFGNYSCISRSSLGNVSGTITLQELKLPDNYGVKGKSKNNKSHYNLLDQTTSSSSSIPGSLLYNEIIIHETPAEKDNRRHDLNEYQSLEKNKQSAEQSLFGSAGSRNPRLCTLLLSICIFCLSESIKDY